MIRVPWFLAFLSVMIILCGLCLIHSHLRLTTELREDLPRQRQLVRSLQLTDLAFWTEARYTRNPSQADRFTPFQDFPSALEHFPAGSIIAPPEQLTRPQR